MKRLLDDAARKAVEDAVIAAEKRTSAEIVTVLAPASDDYRVFALLYAAVVALLVDILVPVAATGWETPAWLAWMPLVAAATFTFVALVLTFMPSLLRPLLPKRLLHSRAAAMARVQFLAQGLHHTRGETGVLLFVSEYERYVEVLVDRGVSAHVPDEAWRGLVDAFTARVRRGEIVAGFTGALAAAAEMLAAKLPPGDENPDELGNRLVVLP